MVYCKSCGKDVVPTVERHDTDGEVAVEYSCPYCGRLLSERKVPKRVKSFPSTTTLMPGIPLLENFKPKIKHKGPLLTAFSERKTFFLDKPLIVKLGIDPPQLAGREKEYTLIEQFEDQKKDLETMMKLIREGVEKCDPKTLRASLLSKSFINGLKDMLPTLKDMVSEHIYKEVEESVEKTDHELFDLAGKYGKMCYCSPQSLKRLLGK